MPKPIPLDKDSSGRKLENSKCRHWLLKVSTGRGADGKYHSKSMRYAGKYRDACARLAEFQQEVKEGKAGRKPPQTFGECAEAWWEWAVESSGIAESTLKAYSSCKRRLIERIGLVRMASIDADTVEACYMSMQRDGFSPGYIYIHHAVVKNVVKHAARLGICQRGCIAGAKPPPIGKRKKTALTPEQTTALMSALPVETPYGIATALCLCCGLRIGEALSVTWSDVMEGSLRIDKTVNVSGTGHHRTKTPSGMRYVPLSASAKDALERRKKAQCAELAPLQVDGSTRVCLGRDMACSKSSVTHWWKRVREKEYGLPGVTLHDLRRTFATNLARAGVAPSVMQALLGHAHVAVSLEIYTSVHDEDAVKAVSALDEY